MSEQKLFSVREARYSTEKCVLLPEVHKDKYLHAEMVTSLFLISNVNDKTMFETDKCCGALQVSINNACDIKRKHTY